MNKASILVAAVLSLSTVGVGVYAWMSMGDVAMSASGYVALALGVIATMAVGVGLMALLFYSNNHGYDDRAVPKILPHENQQPH